MLELKLINREGLSKKAIGTWCTIQVSLSRVASLKFSCKATSSEISSDTAGGHMRATVKNVPRLGPVDAALPGQIGTPVLDFRGGSCL
jgi:hypothetical protein